jgi:putative transposase
LPRSGRSRSVSGRSRSCVGCSRCPGRGSTTGRLTSRPNGRCPTPSWLNEIEAIFVCSAQTYGAPRANAWLVHQGDQVGHNRVARIMRDEGFVGEIGRRKVRTTVADKTAKPSLDLVGRNFNPTTPNEVWCGDITYIATGEGWLFLATSTGSAAA